MRMLANRTDSEERLVSELLGKNADLQRKLDDIKEYIIAASADGWIGKDDPVYHEFNLHIVRHENKITAFCSFKVDDISNGATRNVFRKVLITIGLTKDEVVEKLKIEISDRENEEYTLKFLMSTIKRTTESARAEKYSDFYDKLPKGIKLTEQVLSITKDTSSAMFGVLNGILPTSSFRSRYMRRNLDINGLCLIPSADIPNAFKAIRMEAEYLCLYLHNSKLEESMRVVLQGLVNLTRQFAVIINKYYAKEVGIAFAEIASDRFRAAYELMRGVSSLHRASMCMEKPHLLVLEEYRMLTQNLQPVVTGINSHVQRKYMQKQFASNLALAIELCSAFLADNLAVLTNMAYSGETVARTICASEEYESVVVDAELICMLHDDQDDTEYLVRDHENVSVRFSTSGLDVKYEDIADELQKLHIKKMELPYDELEETASGSYATVREVPWNDSKILVAVKRFKVIPSEQRTMKRLVREAQITTELRHKNVLSIFGYSNIPSESNETGNPDTRFITYALVYPMYRKGCLQDYLVASNVAEEGKLKILLDVATALAYLHDPKKNIGVVIHGDLRAANVLIGPSGEALLCDFGLSTHENIDEKWQTSSRETHAAWMPYEFFKLVPPDQDVERPKLTVKTDVFAFGCVCYEVVHEHRPYYECIKDPNQISLRKSQTIPPKVDIPVTYRARAHLKQLMEICWRVHPPRRPSASRLECILRGLMESLL